MTAVELLVALHTIDLSQIDLKFVVKSASLCLSESDVYSHEVLAVVLQVSLSKGKFINDFSKLNLLNYIQAIE